MRIKKIIQVVERFLITKIALINGGLYKKIYPNYLRRIGIKIPLDYYENNVGFIDPSAYFDGNDYRLISIGKNTTISMQVIFLTHDYSITKGLKAIEANTGGYFLKPISVGNNCFIGARSFLLPGTTIGDNVIIGAGSVVKGSIPSNCVAAGNPAKVICPIDEWAEGHYIKKDYIEVC